VKPMPVRMAMHRVLPSSFLPHRSQAQPDRKQRRDKDADLLADEKPGDNAKRYRLASFDKSIREAIRRHSRRRKSARMMKITHGLSACSVSSSRLCPSCRVSGIARPTGDAGQRRMNAGFEHTDPGE